MPKLLLVTTGTDLGGAEIQTELLALELVSRGWEVRVVGLIPSGVIAARLEQVGIPCSSLGMQRGVPSIAAIRQLRDIVRTWRPDLVHSHMVHANIMTRIAVGGGAPWPPLVCTVHNINEGGGWRPWAYRLTDRRACRTTHVSERGLNEQRKAGLLSNERSLWIPNAVRIVPTTREQRTEQPGSPFTWLYIGRLEPVKRLPHLLRCFTRIVSRYPESRLLVVGGGRDAAVLQQMCETEPLKSAVTLLGAQQDVHPWLLKADAFITLAEHEGMPLTLLEAGMYGLPVVATDVGGVSEIIPTSQHGWVVGQSEEAATDAMRAVMTSTPDVRMAIGTRLRNHIAERFSVDAVMPQWLALYQQAMSGAA